MGPSDMIKRNSIMTKMCGQYYQLVMSARIKEIATAVQNDKFNSMTYREHWHREHNLTNLAFETFSQENQKRIIEGMKQQLANSSMFCIFQNRRIKSCLQITEMMLSISREMRRNKLKQEKKKAQQAALAFKKPSASNKVSRKTQTEPDKANPNDKASLRSSKIKVEEVNPTNPTGYQLEEEDEQGRLMKKNK